MHADLHFSCHSIGFLKRMRNQRVRSVGKDPNYTDNAKEHSGAHGQAAKRQQCQICFSNFGGARWRVPQGVFKSL